jgi:exopolyphosphatase/guanosine-5'-triphosphate,3'-diphosphate pyrophosphatase
LRVKEMQVSDGALREGLLYDLLGRLQHEDARERSVRAMAARFNVDEDQATRVAHTARLLLDQCVAKWQLEMPLSANMLEWSAQLHEIGLDISHDGYQRHGAYVAEHADLPGFPRAEQRFLASLIGSQRRQIDTRYQKLLPRAWRKSVLRLTILLRIAVLLNRSRSHVDLPTVDIEVRARSLVLRFGADWLDANPLTVADLEREVDFLHAAGYELRFS